MSTHHPELCPDRDGKDWIAVGTVQDSTGAANDQCTTTWEGHDVALHVEATPADFTGSERLPSFPSGL